MLGGAGLLVAGGVAAMWMAAARWQKGRVDEQRHSIVQAIERVTKLATVEMTVSNWHLRRDEKPLFGFIPITCEKTVAVLYRGKVAAGFDLSGPDAMKLTLVDDRGGRRAQLQLPAARLLYVDVPAPELLVTDGSLCNRMEAGDYVRLHEDAREAVRADAMAAGVLIRAEEQARALVSEVLSPLGYRLEVQVTGSER